VNAPRVVRDLRLVRARRWLPAVAIAVISGMAVVTDPERRRDTSDGIVPAPYHVVARFGDRWVVSNVAPWACAEQPPRVAASDDAGDGRLVTGLHTRRTRWSD
jgi:hypothetical protein